MDGYDGNAQCDCFKYDLETDIEVLDDIFPKFDSEMKDIE